jgi:hypothetical protein
MMSPLLAPVEGHVAIGGAPLESVTNTDFMTNTDDEASWPTLLVAGEKGLKAIVGALLAAGEDKEAKDQVRRRRVQASRGLFGVVCTGLVSFCLELIFF